MLTASERAQVKRDLRKFADLPYGQIAAILTESFGRKISRNTVRYYLGSMPGYAARTKGRPSGSKRERDIWGQLLPELLALTGLSASRLYRELTHLLMPTRLPFSESGFHERTGRRSPVKEATKKKRLTCDLLERCNLRVKVVDVCQNDGEGRRVYLFGYEELTGYTAFDVISSISPNARRVLRFVKTIEDHLGLPVRRVRLIGKELRGLAESKLFEHVCVQCLDDPKTSYQLVSPYKRRAEIDLLQSIAKKQNDEVARAKVAVAKDAIALFVQRARSRAGGWTSKAQRDITRRLQADAAKLDPFLKSRFKLYVPMRRPR